MSGKAFVVEQVKHNQPSKVEEKKWGVSVIREGGCKKGRSRSFERILQIEERTFVLLGKELRKYGGSSVKGG